MAMLAYVTGATGFLGQAVCRRLASEGIEVHGLCRKPPRFCHGHLEVDLTSLENLCALSRRKDGPDVVIHLGARVGWLDEALSELYPANVLATGILAGLAQAWGARLVFASTAIVHGSRTERIDDRSALRPDTDYGKSKLIGEELVRASGVPHSILRFGGIFGAGGPDHLSINRAIDAAAQGTTPAVNMAGQALRSYLHVEDAAAVVLRAAHGELDGTHLVAGSTSSIASMVQSICNVYLPGTRPTMQPGGDVRDQVVVPSDGIPLVRSFEDALRQEAGR